jgi:hypothetical protein
VPVGEVSAMANHLHFSTCLRKSESSQLVPGAMVIVRDSAHQVVAVGISRAGYKSGSAGGAARMKLGT